MKNVKYIYNPTQARFYISHGVLPITIDLNINTMKKFWVFGTEETEEVYSLWCKKCKEYNKMKN